MVWLGYILTYITINYTFFYQYLDSISKYCFQSQAHRPAHVRREVLVLPCITQNCSSEVHVTPSMSARSRSEKQKKDIGN